MALSRSILAVLWALAFTVGLAPIASAATGVVEAGQSDRRVGSGESVMAAASGKWMTLGDAGESIFVPAIHVADDDCAGLRRQLALQWQRDSTQVFHLGKAVEECFLLAVNGNWNDVSAKQLDTLMRISKIGVAQDTVAHPWWLTQRGLMAYRLGKPYENQLLPWFMEAIAANPESPTFAFFLLAHNMLQREYRAGRLTLPTAVSYYVTVDRVQSQMEILGVPDAYAYVGASTLTRLDLRAVFPDCGALAQRFTPDKLNAPDSALVYLRLADLQGCGDTATWQHALRVALRASENTELRRLAAAEAFNRGDWAGSRAHWLAAIALEPEHRLQAADQVQVAETWRLQGDHRKARAALRAAIGANPRWGEPYIRLMDLYLDGAKACNFSPMEEKAVYWLLIDLCHELLLAAPNYAAQANERLYRYRSLVPTTEEAAIMGFRPGDTFPFKCWMSTTVVVPLD